MLPSSGSAVHLPKLHYTTVHAALKDITLSETDVSAAALLFVWFSAVKYKRSEYNKLFLLSQVEEDFWKRSWVGRWSVTFFNLCVHIERVHLSCRTRIASNELHLLPNPEPQLKT